MNIICTIIYSSAILSSFFGIIESSIGDSTLQWAPHTLKSPYISFINNFNYATWKTRHSITKEAQALRHLKLPRSVPFSIGCGACFQRSQTPSNLSITVTGHDFYSIPKTHSGKVTKFSVPGSYLECHMTYVQTSPIMNGGEITCTLQRGRQQKKEVISFSAVDVTIDDAPEELEIQQDEETIQLHCPTPDQPTPYSGPLVHVWSQEDPLVTDLAAGLIPELQPSIVLRRPKQTLLLACSVYSIANPTTVLRRHYKILGSENHSRQEYQLSNGPTVYGVDKGMSPSRGSNMPNFLLGIIIAVVVVAALIISVTVYQFVVAARRK